MPIYEFKCRKCGNRFETLCRIPGENDVACPSCKGRKVSRLMSTFVSRGSGNDSASSRATGSSCAGCRSKSCSTCR